MAVRRKTSTKPAIERMRWIAMFLRQQRAFTAGERRKTIVRDLDFLRSRLGFEIRFNRRLNRYCLLSAPAPVL